MSLPAFGEVRSWMFERALPFWAEAGIDRVHGGFHEDLTLDGLPSLGEFRRLRVICRQIYVFSHAATLGWKEGLGAAEMGVDYLVAHGWLGPDIGWARRLTRRGQVLDVAPDLYDHAFVLFALGWWHRASGDPAALVWAHRTLDFVEAHLRHPRGPGFLHARPPAGWRLQNPHMHLLEAALALFEACGHARFAELAEEVGALFERHFFDADTGTLGEVYTEELARAPGEPGRVTEPGHHFEWAWLLAARQRLLGVPGSEAAGRLVAFAERHGVHPVTRMTYNRARDDGLPLDRGSRTWPNTERLKGHVALFELQGLDPRVALVDVTRVLLDRYLAHRPGGTWQDHFDGDGAPIATTIPAATFYHLFLAFSELLRLEPALRALAGAEERRHAPPRFAHVQRVRRWAPA